MTPAGRGRGDRRATRPTIGISAALCGALLAGCAAPPYMGVRASDPPLPAIEGQSARTEETWVGARGVPLYSRGYRPASGEVRAVVVIMNGLKDYGDHYAAFSQLLNRHGYAAYAFDLRGHGRSGGRRVDIDRFDDFVDDLAAFVERVRAREPGKPIFVLGHSVGGAITALYAIERQPNVAGVILSAPAIAIDGPAIQAAAIRFTDAVAPNMPLLDPPDEGFSRSPEVVAGMHRDALVYQSPGPVHTAAELLDCIHRVWSHPEQLRVPLLVLHGTADRLTSPAGSRDLVMRAGSADKTLRLYPSFYHDLIPEPGGERVVSDVLSWLDAHQQGAPSGEPPSPPPTTDLTADGGPRPLVGDRAASSTSMELDGRGERVSEGGGTYALTAGLRLRQGFGRVGWLGGLDARIGTESGLRWEADGYLLGLGARSAAVAVGLTAGIGGWGIENLSVVRVPAELSLESSAGPVRVLARGGLGWHLNQGGPGTSAAGIADDAFALVGLRLGRDVRYWADVFAGDGPFLAATYTRRLGMEAWGLSLGLNFWGEN
jgi:acylglycerol lipase